MDGVPEVLAVGDQGFGVAWLQNALADLGYYPGEASGRFDGTTRAGVMALQLDQDLTPDGVAGPRTQMVLYSLLEGYEVPRLTGVAEEAPRAVSGAAGAGAADYEDREPEAQLRAGDESG